MIYTFWSLELTAKAQGVNTTETAVNVTRTNIPNVTHILPTPLNIIADTRFTDHISSRIVILTKVVTPRFVETNRNHNADGSLHHIRAQEMKIDKRLPPRFA